MPSSPSFWPALSRSSKMAFRWAITRASEETHNDLTSETYNFVTSIDLLVGILLSHPGYSEPQLLLEYFQIPLLQLINKIQTSRGFIPGREPREPFDPIESPELEFEKNSEIRVVLAESWELAPIKNDDKKIIRLRDLFGGILRKSNQAAIFFEDLFSEAPVPIKKLRETYPKFLHYRSTEKTYTQFLGEHFPLPTDYQSPRSLRFAVSGFNADTSAERDLIGIGAEVDAFAYLMAAKGLEPPLAVGLFGDWGSGKSFFMEALRNRIYKITADARASGKPQNDISIYKHVAQIEFNAWHYVDGELWASLVDHIFHNLQTNAEDELPLLQQRQKFYIDELEMARRSQRAAQAEMKSLEEERSKLEEDVSKLKTERDDAVEKLNKLKARDVMDAVVLEQNEKDVIDTTLKKYGVDEFGNSAVELKNAADDLHGVLLRGNALLTPLREKGWRWALALIVVAFIGPVVSLLLSLLPDIPGVTNILVSVSAFLSGLTVMLKQGTAWLATAVSQVEKAQNQLENKRRAVEQSFAVEIAAAETALADAESAYETADKQEKEIAEEINRIERELQQLTPGRVLFDFIKERVGSEDYRQYLGIAALIRRDFDQLSKLIASQNIEFIKNDKGDPPDPNQHAVNRIILYIDDLDRCPPDRVVEVLQAVHLLLAFPLFVVVVAVDARWLSQSLHSHFENLLVGDGQRNFSDGFSRQASPEDYLEKIFQVPFWIRPLSDRARSRIVQGLVEKSLIFSPPDAEDDDSAGGGQANGQNGGYDDTEGREVVHWDPKVRPIDQDSKTVLRPESLDIHEIELRFMEDLREILGETPRSVKRFVNVYRLIKAISLNSSPHFVEDESTAEFKRVLFLLAVLTGLPNISREFFHLALLESLPVQPNAVAPAHNAPQRYTLADIMNEMRKQYISDLDTRQELDRLANWVSQYQYGNWQQQEVRDFAEWIPHVVRYSYRIEES